MLRLTTINGQFVGNSRMPNSGARRIEEDARYFVQQPPDVFCTSSRSQPCFAFSRIRQEGSSCLPMYCLPVTALAFHYVRSCVVFHVAFCFRSFERCRHRPRTRLGAFIPCRLKCSTCTKTRMGFNLQLKVGVGVLSCTRCGLDRCEQMQFVSELMSVSSTTETWGDCMSGETGDSGPCFAAFEWLPDEPITLCDEHGRCSDWPG